MGTTYASAGVNLELGNDASKILYNAAKLTWTNRKGRIGEVIIPFDDFSGIRYIDLSNLPNCVMNINFDGVGTKMEIAERIGKHDTIAYDLFAMVCDDAIIRGGEPVLVGSILDVNTLGQDKISHIDKIRQLATGYIGAAKAANVAVVNGELAELGKRVGGYGPFNYNWGAACVWFARKDRLITGKKIKDGDFIIGLQEEGFRSNGLSLARKILTDSYGPEWHVEHEDLAMQVLEPSKIYSAAVAEMFGGFDGEPSAEISGFVHVTGGGIPEKLGRVLRSTGLGAHLYDHCKMPGIMETLQELGSVSDTEAYRAWNMGSGGMVITSHPSNVIKIAEKHGINAKLIGSVTKEFGQVIKINDGNGINGETLEFKIEK